jgi:hypothetical protein
MRNDYKMIVFKQLTMITLQKERENPLKISFCFQTGDKIVIYVSRNDYKMIVFKQLTISIKTQNDNKMKVYFHVAGINKMLHYMLNMNISC